MDVDSIFCRTSASGRPVTSARSATSLRAALHESTRQAHLRGGHRDGQRAAVAVVEIAALGVDDDLTRPLPVRALKPALVLHDLHLHDAQRQQDAERDHCQPHDAKPIVPRVARILP
ncbi:MAG: hypothetical protein IPH86_18005 [bacterium]|nr:hypothetical protein [bacterium]